MTFVCYSVNVIVFVVSLTLQNIKVLCNYLDYHLTSSNAVPADKTAFCSHAIHEYEL